MAERCHQARQIERDERLILDDHDVGRELAGDLATGLVDQVLQLGVIDGENQCGFLRRELLYSNQQEGLPRLRRECAQIAFGGVQFGLRWLGVALVVPSAGIHNLQKRSIQGHAWG